MGAKLFKPLFDVGFVMVGGDGTFTGDEFYLPLNSFLMIALLCFHRL